MAVKTPKLIIIAGPSGAGKTTTCNFVESNFQDVIYYKEQWTTRKPRPGEEGKGAYKSASMEDFLQAEKEGKILMKTEFAGNRYWYTVDFLEDIEKMFREKKSLVIDSIQPVENWLNFKKQFPQMPIVTIFLFSAELELLKSRIMKRSSANARDVEARLEHAKNILAEANFYDFKIDTSDFNNFESKISLIVNEFN